MWLKSKLTDALGSNHNVIIFCHFPLYPESIDLTLWNYSQIMNILESFPNVIAYINGHYHQGGYGYKNGVHYFTQHAMVDTPDKNSYSILEIYSDEIRIKGYGAIADTILTYSDFSKR
jgi:manganese-dependent ADP-ribose/CDP-alcohol diphosphatase